MLLEQSIEIAAPPERVWAIMADVERWHEWTASITSVKRFDDGPLGVGSRVRVRQPRLRPAVFEVTAFERGRAFVWETRSGGLTATASHEATPIPGGSRVRLALDFSGWPMFLLAWWVRRISVRYLTLEAQGLKRRAEGTPS